MLKPARAGGRAGSERLSLSTIAQTVVSRLRPSPPASHGALRCRLLRRLRPKPRYISYYSSPSARPARAFVLVVAQACVDSGAEFEESAHEPEEVGEAVGGGGGGRGGFYPLLPEAPRRAPLPAAEGGRHVGAAGGRR